MIMDKVNKIAKEYIQNYQQDPDGKDELTLLFDFQARVGSKLNIQLPIYLATVCHSGISDQDIDAAPTAFREPALRTIWMIILRIGSLGKDICVMRVQSVFLLDIR